MGAGGIQNDSLYYNCTGGATGYLDRLLLGENHLYQHAPVRQVYRSPVVFDPENILGKYRRAVDDGKTFYGRRRFLFFCCWIQVV